MHYTTEQVMPKVGIQLLHQLWIPFGKSTKLERKRRASHYLSCQNGLHEDEDENRVPSPSHFYYILSNANSAVYQHNSGIQDIWHLLITCTTMSTSFFFHLNPIPPIKIFAHNLELGSSTIVF